MHDIAPAQGVRQGLKERGVIVHHQEMRAAARGIEWLPATASASVYGRPPPVAKAGKAARSISHTLPAFRPNKRTRSPNPKKPLTARLPPPAANANKT